MLRFVQPLDLEVRVQGQIDVVYLEHSSFVYVGVARGGAVDGDGHDRGLLEHGDVAEGRHAVPPPDDCAGEDVAREPELDKAVFLLVEAVCW